MRSESQARWAMPVLALLSLLGSTGTALLWHARHNEEAAAKRDAAGTLQRLLVLERAYYANNHAYASSLSDVDFEPGTGAWRYGVLASRIGRRPLLLIEADDGTQRVSVDAAGTLRRSAVTPLPDVPAWLPVKEVSHAKKR